MRSTRIPRIQIFTFFFHRERESRENGKRSRCGGNQFGPPKGGDDEKKPKKKKFEPRQASRVGKKRRKKGQASTTKLPKIRPQTKCRLRYLKLERMKDYLLIEEEFIRNQEVFKPKKEKDEEEREKVDDLRGSPMSIGTR